MIEIYVLLGFVALVCGLSLLSIYTLVKHNSQLEKECINYAQELDRLETERAKFASRVNLLEILYSSEKNDNNSQIKERFRLISELGSLRTQLMMETDNGNLHKHLLTKINDGVFYNKRTNSLVCFEDLEYTGEL